MGLNDCKIITLPTHKDTRGILTFIEGSKDIPFDIKRVYYLHSSAGHLKRGVHAHKKLKQLFISVSGSFDVMLDDGIRNKTYRLNNPMRGLMVSGIIWREITNLSSGSVCLVLASDFYDVGDYIYDYTSFREIALNK